MFDDRAWYLLARSTSSEDSGKLLAFAHFRFDMDYDDEVLYVYEIQLEDCVKRKGLGKFMMQVIIFRPRYYRIGGDYMYLVDSILRFIDFRF